MVKARVYGWVHGVKTYVPVPNSLLCILSALLSSLHYSAELPLKAGLIRDV